MELTLKKRYSYKNTMLFLSIMCALAAVGCSLLGYIILPFAASLYATLLLYENKEKRIISYVLPVIMFVVNYAINGILSLEAVSYVVIGTIIYLSYVKKRSKAEGAFIATLTLLVFILISALLLAFSQLNAFGATVIEQFYSNLYINTKKQVVDLLSSIITVTEEGENFFMFNTYVAKQTFNELWMMILPGTILFSFFAVGASYKLFCSNILKYSGEESQIFEWNFRTSNFVAYFYVVLAIINLFITGSGVFATSVSIINTIFLAVFAYIGLGVVYSLLLARGRAFAIVVIIIAFFIISSSVLTILSFIGVYFNIMSNKVSNLPKSQNKQ